MQLIDNIIILHPAEGEAEPDSVTRTIDELQRIVIPNEFVQELGIRVGDKIDLYHSDNLLILKFAF